MRIRDRSTCFERSAPLKRYDVLRTVSVAVFASALLSFAEPGEANSTEARVEYEHLNRAAAEEHASLERRFQAFVDTIRKGADRLRAEPPLEPETLALEAQRLAEAIEVEATAILDMLGEAGAPDALTAIETFANRRRAFVADADILEIDRRMLLEYWDEVLAGLNATREQHVALRARLERYRQRVHSHRTTISEFHIVDNHGRVAELIDDMLSPLHIADLAGAQGQTARASD